MSSDPARLTPPRLAIPRDPISIVASMFESTPDEAQRIGLARWHPERLYPWPEDIPHDPNALDQGDVRFTDAMKRRAIVELREQRNAARLADLVWAGRVVRDEMERSGDPVAKAQLKEIARVVREEYRLTKPLPEGDANAVLAHVRDLRACPAAWRRFARR